MQLQKAYMYYKSAIKPELCKKIIDLGTSKLIQAETIDGKDVQNKSMTVAGNDLTKEELWKVDLKTFQFVIDAGVKSVMIGHLDVPELTDVEGVPATFSYNVTIICACSIL